MIRHLILVGLPGAGKTTVGSALAARLGRPFIDFDSEIERRERRSVSEIFASSGEPYFRDLERQLTSELVHARPAIVAPGGGWIMNPGVAGLVRPIAAVIYLRARPATVLHRLGSDRHARPLLTGGDPLATLEHLLAERDAAYSSADHVIDTDLLDPQQLMNMIAELASASGGG